MQPRHIRKHMNQHMLYQCGGLYTTVQNTGTIQLKDTIIHKSVGAKYKNYKVVDKATGVEYEFALGTRIQNSEVFAGKGTRHPLHEGVAEGLTAEFGGTPSKW